MFLCWKVRYYDRGDKLFKDRDLNLDTNTLDPATKAAVELCRVWDERGHGRGMLRFRHLFQERQYVHSVEKTQAEHHGNWDSFIIIDYFEDEAGNDMSGKPVTVMRNDQPCTIVLPGVAKQMHTAIPTARSPFDLTKISMSPRHVTALGYFSRDMRELMSSPFMKEGPGTLFAQGDKLTVKTAVTADEIRAFVMVFRRLYMEKEPAGFLKAVSIFDEVLSGDPLAGWVTHFAGEYTRMLSAAPHMVPGVADKEQLFCTKRLIDVFLYTQYAHQPDEKRAKQFKECLDQIGGSSAKLVWVFLTAVWQCSITMMNAGRIVADFYDRYCQCHQTAEDIVASVLQTTSGIGALEKKDVRRQRLFREKAEELSTTLWQAEGRPNDPPKQFIRETKAQMCVLLGLESEP
jgi:hypothetical protein